MAQARKRKAPAQKASGPKPGRRKDPESKDPTKQVPATQGVAAAAPEDYPELEGNRRLDPRTKSGPAEMAWAQVVGGRPDMHYVRVGFNSISRQRYEAMGYMYVRNVPNGPHFRAGEFDKDTGFVMVQDCVLMCISKVEKARIDKEGWDGASGIDGVLAREKRMDARGYHEGVEPGSEARAPGGSAYFRFGAAEG